MEKSPMTQPMSLWMSVLVLCVLVAIGIASLYLLLPALDRAGGPVFWNFTLTVYGMFPLLLILAFVGYWLEDRTLSIAGLGERFRIRHLDKSAWLWTLGLLVIHVGGQLLLAPTAGWLVTVLPLPLPEALPPAVDPRVAQSAIPTEFLGLPLRGNGESDKPTAPAAYTTDKMEEDILAVADACGAERFVMWAMSLGGKISRYLAARSERVEKYVLIGTPLGPGVVGDQRQMAVDFLAHWTPIMQAQSEGTLHPETLSLQDRDLMQRLDVPSMLGWVRAMLDWPSVEPAYFRCPTLWLMGSENRHAIDSLHTYEQAIEGSLVQVQVVEGLNHDTAFDEIGRVYPIILAFTRS